MVPSSTSYAYYSRPTLISFLTLISSPGPASDILFPPDYFTYYVVYVAQPTAFTSSYRQEYLQSVTMQHTNLLPTHDIQISSATPPLSPTDIPRLKHIMSNHRITLQEPACLGYPLSSTRLSETQLGDETLALVSCLWPHWIGSKYVLSEHSS